MNCKIPFTKDITFEHKLYEITSISLEHEIKVEDDTLKGNFIVSGDFKSHEVSVNKEAFSYILPFEISLSEDIDKDSIEFMIEDFTYEVIENSILRVNIDFNVIGSVKEKKEELEERSVTDSLFQTVEDNMELKIDKEKEPDNLIEKKIEEDDKKMVEEVKEVKEEDIEITNVKNEGEIDSSTIINNIQNKDDEYATYHIHMVSDGESVETICTMYNSSMSILGEYNNLNEISVGDKIIIPDNNE